MEVIGQHLHVNEPGQHPPATFSIAEPYTVDLEQGEKIAREFLQSRFGYGVLDLSRAGNREGVLLYDFWNVINDTVIYPRQISVEIAADDGEVLAFYRHYRDREYGSTTDPALDITPIVTREEARGMVNPQNTILDEGALVYHHDDSLSWRFLVEREGRRYRVYLDTQTGREVSVYRVDDFGSM